jgi:hypothetical protein
LAINPKIIGTEESVEVFAVYDKGLLSKESYAAIKGRYTQHIIIYGFVKYADAAKRPYRTGFGMLYRPAGFMGDKDFFALGPAKYNRNK